VKREGGVHPVNQNLEKKGGGYPPQKDATRVFKKETTLRKGKAGRLIASGGTEVSVKAVGGRPPARGLPPFGDFRS